MHFCPVSRTLASVQEREYSCADTQILSFQNSKNLGFPRMFTISFVAQTHYRRNLLQTICLLQHSIFA